MKKILTKFTLLTLILAPLSGCQFFKKKSTEPAPTANETTDTTTPKKSSDLEKLESSQQAAAKGSASIDEANETGDKLQSATKAE